MYLYHITVAICVFGVIQGFPNGDHAHSVVERQERPNPNEAGQCPTPENVKCPPSHVENHPLSCNVGDVNSCSGNKICCAGLGDSTGCCVSASNLGNNAEESSESESSGESSEEDENEPSDKTDQNDNVEEGEEVPGAEEEDTAEPTDGQDEVTTEETVSD